MKKYTRFIALIAVICLLAFFTAACAAPTTSSSAPAESSSAAPSESTSAAPAESSAEAEGTAAADESLQKVKDAGKFILGLDDSFPPMGFRNDDNEVVGFDIDLAKEVCSRIGVELECQPIDWAAKEMELNGGNIDCIWNGMSITDERKESMSLSNAYMKNTMAIIVAKDSGIKTKADLAGKKVAVQDGSSAMDAVKGEKEVCDSFAELLGMANNVLALTELKNGTVDAVVGDSVVIDYQIAQWGLTDSYTVLDDNFASEEYAIGFRKADIALTDAVNAALADMKADGTLAKISNTWFGKDITII